MGWGSLPWSISRPTHPVLGLAHLIPLQCSTSEDFNYTKSWKSHTWCLGQAPKASLLSSEFISSVPNYPRAIFPSVKASPSTWAFTVILNPQLLSFLTEDNYYLWIFVFLIKTPQDSCFWLTSFRHACSLFSLSCMCLNLSSFWIQCLLSIF